LLRWQKRQVGLCHCLSRLPLLAQSQDERQALLVSLRLAVPQQPVLMRPHPWAAGGLPAARQA
jgi:hypothetical protein